VTTIKLCACPAKPPATLLAAIRRSAIEIERTGRIHRPLPAASATTAPA
jgi:hypothetical protein